MPRFAKIRLVENPNRRIPNGILSERIDILGQTGNLVTLPMKTVDAVHFHEEASRLLRLAVDELRDSGLMIVLPPPSIGFYPDGVRIATGQTLFPFFACRAAEKASEIKAKKFRRCKCVIIDSGKRLTLPLINSLYHRVNFLTIVTQDYETYAEVADDIIYETGLGIRITEDARNAVSEADIIITTTPLSPSFDYTYKSDSILFDASGAGAVARLARKRSDMLVVDGIRLGGRTQSFDLAEFELGLYSACHDYRDLCKQYDSEQAENVARIISKSGMSLTRLLLDGRAAI